MRFIERLKHAIEHYDSVEAHNLNSEIVKAETKGYQMSFDEDVLWIQMAKAMMSCNG